VICPPLALGDGSQSVADVATHYSLVCFGSEPQLNYDAMKI
jgi:hypothetical protein